LATGSYPFVPPITGAEGKSRLVYRTLDDLDAISEEATGSRRGVIVDGGLLGLEAANALKSLGLEAHVVECAPRLMPVQLDDEGGEYLETDLIVFSAGIRPQDALGRSTGLELGPRGGIAIDDDYQTSDPVIFAIGECAAHAGVQARTQRPRRRSGQEPV
jgi:nitrite reductase (NADH) large subunit